MQSWMLVIMVWSNGLAGGMSVTTAPGLYTSEAECNSAAGSFNDQTEVMQGFNKGAICIPGPKLLMTPVKK